MWRIWIFGLWLLLPVAAWGWAPEALLIWINGDKGYEGIADVGAQFTEATGIPVKVEHPEGATDKFFQAARSGQGPDIMIWAHDRLGEWADVGLLFPVEPSPAFVEKIHPKAWEGFTHRGRIWGYPMAMESTALIYNKALISENEIPRDLADCRNLVAPLAKKGATPIMWDYNNSYFTWGILAADGGYIFGRHADGTYNARDVGVASPGAVAAAESIVGLIRDGVMPTSLSYSVAEAKMNQGTVAMFISGPFAWETLRKYGIDFGVTIIPGINGKPARPFVGVLGAMINRGSPNMDLAQEFLENWLITRDGLAAMHERVSLGVPALHAFYEELAADPHIAGSMANIEVGELMPNIPQMGTYWSAMKTALTTMNAFLATPEAALENAKQGMLPE